MSEKKEPTVNFDKNIDSKVMGFAEYWIKWIIRLLALVIVFVIMLSAIDIVILVVGKILMSNSYIISIEQIVELLGAFLTVLIAIEVYQNIVVYLREDTIQVKVVLATAVIAVSRKVIIMDLSTAQPLSVLALAGIVLAVALAYCLVSTDGKVFKYGSTQEIRKE